MLMVAPSGSTKLATRGDRPLRSITPSIVMGNVAELELVEKAVMRAVFIFLAYTAIGWRPRNRRIVGRTNAP